MRDSSRRAVPWASWSGGCHSCGAIRLCLSRFSRISSATPSNTRVCVRRRSSRLAHARSAANRSSLSATMAPASICNTPTSYSACSRGCIARRISKAPASASRSCSASSIATAGASGPKPRLTRARHFTSRREFRIMTDQRAEILLVEDNLNDVKLTMNAFKTANLANSVHVARDGVEALEFLFCTGPHAGRSIQDRPKLVLLDLKLPRLDGHEVLKRIKGDPRTSAIPVVILTSSAEERDVMRTYEVGANSYIAKPVAFEQFTESVRDIGKYWLEINHTQSG